MAAGIQLGANDVNATFGGNMRDLMVLLPRLEALYQWYNRVGAAALEAAPYNMAAADVNDLGAAASDAHQLYQIFTGQATLATAKDFRTFIERLSGFGV